MYVRIDFDAIKRMIIKKESGAEVPDVYTDVATELFNTTRETTTKEQRQLAKEFIYRKAYSQGEMGD